MSSDNAVWETLPLPEVLAFREGPGIMARDFRDEGIPLLRLAGLKRNASLLDACNYLEEGMVEQRWSHFRVEPGDVLLSTSASLGEVAVVDQSARGAIPYTGIIAFRAKSDRIHPRFIEFALTAPSFKRQIEAMGVGSVMRHFGPTHLQSMTVDVPPIAQQVAIVEVLKALDNKVAVNDRIAATTRDVGAALFKQAVGAEAVEEPEIGALAELVARGVLPKYTEAESELIVLNQKCIRDGRVSLAPARRTLVSKVPVVKRLKANDVLVNSTGVGTLGRVARWAGSQDATADSHVTIVRFDSMKVDVLCAGFAMLAAQHEIERLGEGSTGQTELSRTKLANLPLRVPSREAQAFLSRQLGELESRGEAALAESQTLAALRDTLLPRLMSGAIRVRDAEKAVEEAT